MHRVPYTHQVGAAKSLDYIFPEWFVCHITKAFAILTFFLGTYSFISQVGLGHNFHDSCPDCSTVEGVWPTYFNSTGGVRFSMPGHFCFCQIDSVTQYNFLLLQPLKQVEIVDAERRLIRPLTRKCV